MKKENATLNFNKSIIDKRYIVFFGIDIYNNLNKKIILSNSKSGLFIILRVYKYKTNYEIINDKKKLLKYIVIWKKRIRAHYQSYN